MWLRPPTLLPYSSHANKSYPARPACAGCSCHIKHTRSKKMDSLLMMRKPLALPMAIMLTLVILLSAARPAMAEDNSVAPGRNIPTAPSQALGPTDPAELEAFLDELLGQEMEEHHIAGAAVSVVKDGKLF